MDKAFRALASARRRNILKFLTAGPMAVGEIAAAIGMAVSSTSEHLSILRRAGLVNKKKSGQRVMYTLAVKQMIILSDFLGSFCEPKNSNPRQ
jgi:ArsR family transcriptional regulator, arsenate/arsenite/antimonite-responsive transcriptional repressor